MRTPTKFAEVGQVNTGRYWRNADGTNHRMSGPAIELDSGHKEWWLKGKCHAWQPSVISAPHTPYTYMGARTDLTTFGYQMACQRRPYTSIVDGRRYWLNERGKVHRVEGPAIEWSDGNKQWWVGGLFIRGSEPQEVMFPGYRRITT